MSSRRKIKPVPEVVNIKPKSRMTWVALGAVLIGGIVGAVLFINGRGAAKPAENPPVVEQVVFNPHVDYAGSESCAGCHEKAYQNWKTSHHGLAERAVDLKVDGPAFEPSVSFSHGTQKTEVRKTDGKLEIISDGWDGQRKAHEVKRVIGVKPLRQFLVEHTGGRLQTMEASYDPVKKQWFNVRGDEDRKPGDWLHWTGRSMNWNAMCAACHNTRVLKNFDGATDSYDTKMAQPTVSCESCHGPMKQHVDWQKTYGALKKADPTIKKIGAPLMMEACGSCHARRTELTGDFVPGEKFLDQYALAIPDRSGIFHTDGQVHEEDYEYTSFLSSKMHTAGVKCGDCHEPHTSKPLAAGNALCMRCHNGSFQNSPVIVPEQHSFHKADSAGNQCVNCHMPQTTYMQRHARHDHGFTIPDPVLTRDHGIPNACNRCHTDKDVAWAVAAVEKTHGAKMARPTRLRAQWLAAARAGNAQAAPALLQLLRDEKQSFWKAVIAGMLGGYLNEDQVRVALVELLSNGDPLVRDNALRSLEPFGQSVNSPTYLAISRLLDDPVRSVRLRAAWSMRRHLDVTSKVGKETIAFLDVNADQPLGLFQKGHWHEARGNLDQSIKDFRKAIEWDDQSAAFYESLAVVLSMNGQTAQAVPLLEKAILLEPRQPEFRFKLALAYSELKQIDKTIELLRQTIKIEPTHSRSWYNLGLAHSTLNKPDEAIAALLQAEKLAADDADIPFARATVHVTLNQLPAAREALRKALAIDPRHVDAMRLLQRIGG